MKSFIRCTSIIITPVLASSLLASEESNGPNGINSIATGLNGMGVAIGQVEGGRPGKSPPDTDANCCNNLVVPAAVYARDRDANMNERFSDHALWVASVMISKQTAVESDPPGRSPPIGVAQEAKLYSSAFIVEPVGILQQDAAIAAQHLAKTLVEGSPSVKVGAIMARRKKSVTLEWTEILECRITRSHERGRILDF